jgi:hypothetical protein
VTPPDAEGPAPLTDAGPSKISRHQAAQSETTVPAGDPQRATECRDGTPCESEVLSRLRAVDTWIRLGVDPSDPRLATLRAEAARHAAEHGYGLGDGAR